MLRAALEGQGLGREGYLDLAKAAVDSEWRDDPQLPAVLGEIYRTFDRAELEPVVEEHRSYLQATLWADHPKVRDCAQQMVNLIRRAPGILTQKLLGAISYRNQTKERALKALLAEHPPRVVSRRRGRHKVWYPAGKNEGVD
jgi:phytoene dehydrogenase-like protein